MRSGAFSAIAFASRSRHDRLASQTLTFSRDGQHVAVLVFRRDDDGAPTTDGVLLVDLATYEARTVPITGITSPAAVTRKTSSGDSGLR